MLKGCMASTKMNKYILRNIQPNHLLLENDCRGAWFSCVTLAFKGTLPQRHALSRARGVAVENTLETNHRHRELPYKATSSKVLVCTSDGCLQFKETCERNVEWSWLEIRFSSRKSFRLFLKGPFTNVATGNMNQKIRWEKKHLQYL